MTLLRPALADAPFLTNLPFSSCFALGRLVMFLILRFSNTLISAGASTMVLLVLWQKSLRMLRCFALY
ncbi:hypothetical protein D3C87_1834530 [compost metagenome]